ncbi:MAG: chromate transporter [Acidobacteriota bacterium]
MPAPTLRQLTGVFLRIGNTTFGGGLPTIAALQRELVERNDWLSPEDYALAFSLARVTPGTNVIAFCAAVGARILGFRGALAATLAETAPSAVLAILMTQGYETWRSNAWVMAGIAGTIAAVAGMMWASAWWMLKPYLRGVGGALRSLVITMAAFAAFWKLGLGPVSVIGLAAVVGVLWKEPESEAALPTDTDL